ncbi:TolC family protein [Pectinatus sottacetonis]|uniref:TolC family protein n=1 Tax=Pectinatus sottacetonis TaxID=1002795 RepID=UPI0018C579AC|nr:TolC family protein [Pectinatus sottacetonis]
MKNNKKLIKNLTALILSGFMTLSLTNPVFARQMSLEESITEALSNNHSIKQSEADLEKAKAVLGEAKGNKGLKLTWEGTANKVGGHYYNQYDIDHSYGNVLSASIPVYTGGALENQYKSADLGVEISALTLENEKQTIQLQTIQDYYKILDCQNIKKVRQSAVTQYSEHEKVAMAKYNAGVVPKSDLLRAQVNLADAKQNLITAENDLQIAVTDFNKLIGQNVLTDVEPSDNYLTNTEYPNTLQKCMDTALQNRPDGLAAQKAVLQAQKSVKSAKAGYLPQVSIVAQKDIAGNSMFDDDQTDKSAIGVQADWTIFDSSVTKSQVKQAEATVIHAQQGVAETNDQILLDVRQAYLSMEAAKRNIETTKIAVAQAAEDNRIAQVRYQAGVGTNSDRLDSIVDYVTAQMNYNQALYDYTISRAALNKAMGLPAEAVVDNNNKADKGKDEKVVKQKAIKRNTTEQKVVEQKAENTNQIDQQKNDSPQLDVLDRG